jgi:hypothetical protein
MKSLAQIDKMYRQKAHYRRAYKVGDACMGLGLFVCLFVVDEGR